MNAERIGPESISMLGIADRDVARDSKDVSFARPVAESSGHVLELPLALSDKVGELGYSYAESMAKLEICQERVPGRTTSP